MIRLALLMESPTDAIVCNLAAAEARTLASRGGARAAKTTAREKTHDGILRRVVRRSLSPTAELANAAAWLPRGISSMRGMLGCHSIGAQAVVPTSAFEVLAWGVRERWSPLAPVVISFFAHCVNLGRHLFPALRVPAPLDLTAVTPAVVTTRPDGGWSESSRRRFRLPRSWAMPTSSWARR